jgi:hypothetical protein
MYIAGFLGLVSIVPVNRARKDPQNCLAEQVLPAGEALFKLLAWQKESDLGRRRAAKSAKLIIPYGILKGETE